MDQQKKLSEFNIFPDSTDFTNWEPKELLDFLVNQPDNALHYLLTNGGADLIEKVFRYSDSKVADKLFLTLHPTTVADQLERVNTKYALHFLSVASIKRVEQLGGFISNVFFIELVDANLDANICKALATGCQRKRRADRLRYLDARLLRQVQDDLLINNKNDPESLQRFMADNENRYKLEWADSFRNQFHPAKGNSTYDKNLSKSDTDKLIATLVSERNEFFHKNAKLEDRLKKFEEEKAALVQERIEEKVPTYVTSAIKVLETSENSYKSKAWWWSLYGTVVLIVAIAATVTIALFGGGFIANEGKEVSWSLLMFISFKGLIVLGVLSLWAKHAFSVSNSYIHEAIKRSDRAHAINFGKLYLEIYGSTVERKELLDIFENWNIATESAFSKATPSEFDPKAFEKFVEVAKMLNPVKSAKD